MDGKGETKQITLICPNYQEANEHFGLSFKQEEQETLGIIKDYNVMIDRTNVFDQTVKNSIGTYGSITKMHRSRR